MRMKSNVNVNMEVNVKVEAIQVVVCTSDIGVGPSSDPPTK